MGQRGKQSTAHEYDKRDQCIYCGMYQVNVLSLSHSCTPYREAEEDRLVEAEKEMNDHAE